jgi:hypothetical protein
VEPKKTIIVETPAKGKGQMGNFIVFTPNVHRELLRREEYPETEVPPQLRHAWLLMGKRH